MVDIPPDPLPPEVGVGGGCDPMGGPPVLLPVRVSYSLESERVPFSPPPSVQQRAWGVSGVRPLQTKFDQG